METKIINVLYNQQPCYDIVISDSFNLLSKNISKFFCGKKICIVTDSNVEPLYAKAVSDELKSLSENVFIHSFAAGEKNKNINTVADIYHFLIKNKFDRNDLLVALGGGVCGDITGFCAATYLRGIKFVQIPTTLLSQVDSSIGGKTGVDFESYKNMVGAFKQPSLVYINVSTLKTLPSREYNAGMGEIIKHGIIKDYEYFTWLKNNVSNIMDFKIDIIAEMIYRSCIIKKCVVENDPEEKHERALLNFGHTLGHAIEKEFNFELLHGECVALGSCCAAYISYKKNHISKEQLNEIVNLFSKFSLPCKIKLNEASKINIIEATKNDKKAIGNSIKFVLTELGSSFINTEINDSDMKESLNFINNEEQ